MLSTLILAFLVDQEFTLHNAATTTVTFKGKKATKLTLAPDAQRGGGVLAILKGTENFVNGTIEAELAGEPAPGAAGGARGFVGIAFRVQPDRATYDAFYVRPTNGRADDQERRNHAVQYISHPTYTWNKLRQETPSRYESYADMQPGEWIKIRIEVDGVKARLFVGGVEQPTLIVNDVKSGANAKGPVALWIEGSTIAHYANVKVQNR